MCKNQSRILYINLINFLVYSVSGVPLNAGKHGGSQQIVARLILGALPVSYTQDFGNQTIPLLSLTC